MFLDGSVVFGGGVAFVAVPAVERVLLVELQHEFVAVGFGEDACSGNRHVFGIAFDDALVGDIGLVVEPVSVNEKELGF